MAMIPAGYLYKHVAAPANYQMPSHMRDLYSVSGCLAQAFTGYIPEWKHNGAWLFDEPGIMEGIATDRGLDLGRTTLFYYEVCDRAFDEKAGAWLPVVFDPRVAPMRVVAPEAKTLQGFDVVTFSNGTSPECSPLSCNSLCEDLPVNAHCLMATFEAAEAALTARAFDNSEPGPFRIFAVYTVD